MPGERANNGLGCAHSRLSQMVPDRFEHDFKAMAAEEDHLTGTVEPCTDAGWHQGAAAAFAMLKRLSFLAVQDQLHGRPHSQGASVGQYVHLSGLIGRSGIGLPASAA